jgi:hypothetical protein
MHVIRKIIEDIIELVFIESKITLKLSHQLTYH